MFSWWDSTEALNRINTWTQIATVVFGILVAAATALKIVAANRLAALQVTAATDLQVRLRAAEATAVEVKKNLGDSIQKQADNEQRFREELATANAAAERARRDAEQAHAQALSASQAAEAVRSRTMPRTLTAEQKRHFSQLLGQIRSASVNVKCPLGDPEAQALALEFAGLLHTVGWGPPGISQSVFTGRPVGIIVLVHSESSAPDSAGVLQHALKEIGFEAAGVVNAQVPDGGVELLIGHKE